MKHRLGFGGGSDPHTDTPDAEVSTSVEFLTQGTLFYIRSQNPNGSNGRVDLRGVRLWAGDSE